MISSRAHIVNALILASLFGGSILVYDSLPDRIPRHAGLTGNINAYWPKTWISWMVVPTIVIILSAMMYGMAWLLGQMPDSINTPNQKIYNALSNENKRRVVGIMQRFLYWTAGATALLISSIHWAFYAAVMDGRDSIGAWTAPVAIFFAVAICTAALAAGRRMGRKVESLATSKPE